MERTKQVDLDHLAELERAATPGPWTATGDEHTPIIGPHTKTTRKGDGKPKPVKGTEARIIDLDNHAACSDPDCCTDSPYVSVSPADAALIAAARNALPALLAELRASRAVVAAARARDGCAEECRVMQPYRGCQCGHEALAAALAALDREVGR